MVWRRIVAAWLAWQVYFGELFFVAEQGGIGYDINQVLWKLFGQPEDVYGFRNLILHRLVVFALISAPPTLIGLLVYEKLGTTPPQCKIRDLFFCIAALAVPLGFLRPASAPGPSGMLRASLFVLYLLFVTGYLLWSVAACDKRSGEIDRRLP